LKRLTTATAVQGSMTAWTQSYTYDGFGNMTSKTGSGATFTNSVDATTNRLAGGNICYDPDGNMVSDQNGGGCGNPNYTYDVANRLVSAKVSGGTETYGYDADNKRISKISSSGAQTIYIYGAMGEKLAVGTAAYSAGPSNSGVYGGNAGPSTLLSTNNIYFNGHLISQGVDGRGFNFNFVGTDRLGSVRMSAPFGGPNVSASYLPSGEELNATANDQIKFATYTRDGSTGLDYADQRFYTSQFGRFMSADRFRQAAKANDSGSWNKFSYAQSDPVNYYDPSGESRCSPDGQCADYGYGPGGIGWPILPPCTEDRPGVHADCSGGGGGQGGRGGALQVMNFSNDGPQQGQITNVLNDINAALGANTAASTKCANWLQGDGITGSALISALVDNNSYGHGDFSINTIAAFAGSTINGQSVGVPVTAAFTVNNNGAFFNAGFKVGTQGYQGGTLQAQATILIHELAHIVGAAGFQPDNGNPKAGQSNDNLVNQNCGRLISGLK
jgi:RHS repeat-associated protein